MSIEMAQPHNYLVNRFLNLNGYISLLWSILTYRHGTSSRLPYGMILDENGSSRKASYKWQRVLLKVSGEALAGDHTQNIDPKVRI